VISILLPSPPLDPFELVAVAADRLTLRELMPRGGTKLESYDNGLGGIFRAGDPGREGCLKGTFGGGKGNSGDDTFLLESVGFI
jgi:hypothetical protein